MAVANNSKELYKEIKKRVEKKMKNEIKEDLKEMYRTTVYDTVYRVYRPRKYKRRYTLLKIGSNYKQNEFVLDIFSLGYANYSKPEYGYVNDFLELIEYGHGYNGNYYNMFNDDFSNHRYAMSRPFNKNAIEKAKKIDYQKYFK